MAELHETMMGNKFYSHDVPRMAKAVERIADALEEQNKRTEGPSTEEMEEISKLKYQVKNNLEEISKEITNKLKEEI